MKTYLMHLSAHRLCYQKGALIKKQRDDPKVLKNMQTFDDKIAAWFDQEVMTPIYNNGHRFLHDVYDDNKIDKPYDTDAIMPEEDILPDEDIFDAFISA